MRQLVTILLLSITTLVFADEIIVHKGESIHEALRQAREWRRTNDPRCKGGIIINIKAGQYYMDEPLFIRPEDSGTETSPTLIRGEEGTIIHGDSKQQHTQIWPKEGMERMIDFNKEERTIVIPTPPKQVLKELKDPKATIEMVVHQRWAIAILRIKDIQADGEKSIVSFMEPESRLEFEHPWPQPVIKGEKGSSSFMLRKTEQRDGIEQLVIVSGTEDTPVQYVSFENITFENTCWNRPQHKGHVTLQGGFPIIDAYKLQKEGLPWASNLENQAWIERPAAAVSIDHAKHIHVSNCQFRHLASTALDFVIDINDCTINDNLFTDIGGTAIMAGSFAESPREVHRPYSDLAKRCQGIKITNNRIDDATNEDWGAVAISCGYVRDATIMQNHISHVNYSGICVGWGWTSAYTGMENNHIIYNKVEDYARQLYDAGGIYTLSNQPHSSIQGNTISQPFPAPYATNDRGFCIYLDAETDGYTIENNKTEGRLIRRDEIGDNHPGPNIVFKQQ